MDRVTHARVGGPYASEDDAERAIESGNFDQSPAELTVEPVGDDSKEASLHTGAAVPKAKGFDQEPESLEQQGSPDRAPAPESAPPDDLPGGIQPGDEPGLPGSDVGDAGSGDYLPEVPDPSQSVPPMSTKPAQLPSGGGSMLPPMPGSPQFDPGGLSTGDTDPVAEGIDTVAKMIAEQNPGADEASIRRVARKVVGRLNVEGDFSPFSMVPMIEDPLANESPLSLDVKKKRKQDPLGKERKGDPKVKQDQQGGDDDDGGSSLPRFPLPDLGPDPADIPDLTHFDQTERAGAGAAERGAAGAAERAALTRLPMLLV